MFRRALCLIACLSLALLPALSLAEQSFTMAGFDGADSTHDWTTNQFFTRMEERTRISFTFQQYTNRRNGSRQRTACFRQANCPTCFSKPR